MLLKKNNITKKTKQRSGLAWGQLTLDEKEEADDAHDCDDESGYDEGEAPVGGHPVASDQ